MPLVIVFTKLDLFHNASSSRNDYEERCRSLLGNIPVEIVSSIYSFVCVANKDFLTPVISSAAQVPPSYQQISCNNRWVDHRSLSQNFCTVRSTKNTSAAQVPPSYQRISCNNRWVDHRSLSQNFCTVRSTKNTTTIGPCVTCMVSLTKSKSRHQHSSHY